jgi:4-amino-4-deoxy-L-arabinose transferase-like glycosyltransferase
MKTPHLPVSRRLAFLPLILVYLIYSLPGISRPWGNDHNGFLAKEKSSFAINYLRFGFWDTKVGQKMDEGGTMDSSRKRYSYYIRHPIGISLLTSFSFMLFGVTENASRLVAVLLNVAILTLLYLFFESYFDQKTALLALFFVVFSPMFFYIRHLLAFELLALFFISSILYFYAKWQTTGRGIFASLLIASVLLGTLLSDWQTYFVIPGVVAHNLFFARVKAKKILLLVPLACLMFMVYFAHVKWLTGSFQGEGAGGFL